MTKIIKILITLFSVLIIFLLPIFFIVWQSNIFIPQTPTQEIPELSESDYRKYQSQTLGFLLNKSQLPAEMTELEVSHMEDVKNVFVVSIGVLFFSIFLITFLVFKIKNKHVWQAFKKSSILVILIIILLLILSLFNFENLFIYFHEIFFPQGNWLFAPSSLMVQVFPEELFKKLTISSFSISIIFALSLLFLSFNKIRK